MKKEFPYVSPEIWVIETKPAMPLCTSVTATVDPLSEGEDINVFVF